MSTNLSLDDNSNNDWFSIKQKIEFVYGEKIEKIFNTFSNELKTLIKNLSNDEKEQKEFENKIDNLLQSKLMIENVERIFTNSIMNDEENEEKKENNIQILEEKYKKRKEEILINEMARINLSNEYEENRINEIIEKIVEESFDNDEKSKLFDKFFNMMFNEENSKYILKRWIEWNDKIERGENKSLVYSNELYERIYNVNRKNGEDGEEFEDILDIYVFYEKCNTKPLFFDDKTERYILRYIINSKENESRKESIKHIIHKKKIDLMRLRLAGNHLIRHGFTEAESDDLQQYTKYENKKKKREKIRVRRDHNNRFSWSFNNEIYVFNRESTSVIGKIDNNDEIIKLTDTDISALQKRGIKYG